MVTTYFKNLILNEVFNTNASSSTSLTMKYYLAWSTVVPPNDGIGTGFAEPNVSTGYTRIEITGLSNAIGGMINNANYLSFPESTASQGIAKAYGIFDALSGGNLLVYNALALEKTINAEDTLTFKPNQIKIELKDI